jgi:diguanylate cyclase (GGDEF)-like protein
MSPPSAPLPTSEGSPRSSVSVRPRARSLTEALRHAVGELGASAVGVTRADGGPAKYFTRNAQAAEFFEDVCANGLQLLKAQTQTKGGVFGTNRVRADSNGPVRGRLIAVSLRGAQGAPLGTLVAVRLIDEDKFGSVESQKLLALGREFEGLLAEERGAAAPATRSMWPTDAGPASANDADGKLLDCKTTTQASSAEGRSADGKTAHGPSAHGKSAAPLSAPVAAGHAPSASSSAARAAEGARTKDFGATTTTVAGKLATTGPAPARIPAAAPALNEAPPAAPADAERTAATNEAATPVTANAPANEPPAADGSPDTPPPTNPATRDAYDPIATLLSWSEFERQIRTQESADRSLPGCVLYGDIDQLHVINKLAGFAIGDLAISEVGAALQTAELPQGSCCCHLSGDRFTLYIPRTTLAQGRRIAEQLSKTVTGLSVTVHSVPTPLSISFGVALIPSNEGGLSHALAAAEAACKAAKDRGRGRVEVYQDADQSIVRRNDDVLVADRLRQALDAGRVDVFAQPIVRLNGTQSAANYELLVRLIGDAGTLLSPTWFMSAATRYRMLVELDRAVVGHVLAKLEAHRSLLSCKNLRFSVNLSGPSIGDPDFLEWLMSGVGGAGVPGEWLQFEITEMAAVANIAQTQAMIRRLQSRGVQFALDDFGTGVSSLAYLKYFDVKMLKLDGSFVRDLLSNPRSESLVRGIAQLGRGMGIETVAECVETYEVRDRLADLGVDCAQGFLFGRPRPFDGILANELGLSAVPNAAAARVGS